jgi:hypothetical protein
MAGPKNNASPGKRGISNDAGARLSMGLGVLALSCYKTEMPKIIEQWLLFKYIEGQFTPLSKPFKTKAAAEKARLKLPEWERRWT